MLRALVDALACPRDGAGLLPDGGGVLCAVCGTHYPFEDGVLILDRGADARRRAAWSERDERTVEPLAVARRIGAPRGVVLDHGAGTGDVSEALLAHGHAVVAVDSAVANLAQLVRRAGPAPLIAVRADVRGLPIRSGAITAVASVDVYAHVRGRGPRLRMLDELARVLAPGGTLVLTALNFNLHFRWERARGDAGAREGDRLAGDDGYYRRFTRAELRAELENVFALDELVGIRNVAGRRLDIALERTPLSAWTGACWLARAHAPLRRTATAPLTFSARSRVDRLLRERRAPT